MKKLLKIKIVIENDSGLKSELTISETDNLTKLVIIQNVFNLFGVDNDILSTVETFRKTGEAYASFFSQVDPIEPKVIEVKSDEIKDKMIQGLAVHKDELDETYKNKSDQPSYIETGIKIDDDGTKRYRMRYKCLCGNVGTHYIYIDSTSTFCHSCKSSMKVFPAHPENFPNTDTFGNFFRAGDYKDWNLF